MLDAERQIRFLYPPVFLIASLFLGVRLDDDATIADVCRTLIGQDMVNNLSMVDWSTPAVAVATASGLVAMVSVGFLIGSVTVLFLRISSKWWAASGTYEAGLLPNAGAVRKRLQVPAPASGTAKNADALFLAAALDHELIAAPVHRWIFRRWSMFYMYANSVTALLIALVVGLLVGVGDWQWSALSALVIALFVGLAAWAWRDTVGMITFQAQRPLPLKQLSVKEKEE
jgi:hypothetical protein